MRGYEYTPPPSRAVSFAEREEQNLKIKDIRGV